MILVSSRILEDIGVLEDPRLDMKYLNHWGVITLMVQEELKDIYERYRDISGYLRISRDISGYSVIKYLNYMGSFELDLVYLRISQ